MAISRQGICFFIQTSRGALEFRKLGEENSWMIRFDSLLNMYIYRGHTLLDKDPIALGATSFAHYESRADTHFI